MENLLSTQKKTHGLPNCHFFRVHCAPVVQLLGPFFASIPTSLKLTSTDKGRRHRSWLWDNESTCDFSNGLFRQLGWMNDSESLWPGDPPSLRGFSLLWRSSRCFSGSIMEPVWLYLPIGGFFVGSQPVRRWSRWNMENGPPVDPILLWDPFLTNHRYRICAFKYVYIFLNEIVWDSIKHPTTIFQWFLGCDERKE